MSAPSLLTLRQILQEQARACLSHPQRFFKVGAGDYAAHDQFMGLSTPVLRKLSQSFADLPLKDLTLLMHSPFNEERLLALFILVRRYQQGHPEEAYAFYLKHMEWVNNWNLVDASAHHILGAHLWERDRSLLKTLASSGSLWKRRIAIVATWYFIRHGEGTWTLALAQILMRDPEDLIHKAVGWMLRELGKKDTLLLKDFLNQHAHHMPRTMLRYAIEKFSKEEQVFYRKKLR